MKRTPLAIILCVLACVATSVALPPRAVAVDADRPKTSPKKILPKKIVLIAGKKSHGPGHHEYEKGMRLVKWCLDKSQIAGGITTELHTDGWPDDPSTLDDADTIVLFCDGSDRSLDAHPLLTGTRLKTLERQMKRGCGLVVLHYTVFVPTARGGAQFLEWVGGYFDYESGAAANRWFSKIRTAATTPQIASADHPISRGLKAFDLREEYYYNMRFVAGDKRRTPILTTSIPGEADVQTVAWCVEREEGGRGFGFTGGHFHDNWKVENYRRMILNAVLWTARAEVPEGGVTSKMPSEREIASVPVGRPIRALIVTGHQHPAHKWKETTQALEDVFGEDRRIRPSVVVDPQTLSDAALAPYDVLVLNYCNWQRKGLPEKSKAALAGFVRRGGGLVIIHFANGAFHFSLPDAAQSDWPEYRTRLCRRVWEHGKSGHDPYGPFRVAMTDVDHPITQGAKPFDTTDELYYRQQGNQPITVLATARSKATNQDEPMAMVYDYGKGRVFQTVLGHAAESIRNPGAARLIRRGTVWAAARKQIAADSGQPAEDVRKDAVTEGRFGKAVDARRGFAVAAGRDAYGRLPLTVECWAKIDGKSGFNILVANHPKASADHWEIYTYAGTGDFSAYLPGYAPAEIRSGVVVTDGKWHFVAMTFDGDTATLFVDGKQVKRVALKRQRTGGPKGPLWIGTYGPRQIGCDGVIDEVRISGTIRKSDRVPEGPLAADEQTIGLWNFDKTDGARVEDAAKTPNAATLELSRPGNATSARPAAKHADGLSYRVADPDLKLVEIDRSPTESFLSIRADTTGRLFVGGREALFVYEPNREPGCLPVRCTQTGLPGEAKRNGSGGYQARQLLYRFPPDTWLTDIEIRGDDLYVMTVAALYKFPGGRILREGLKPQRLIWGSPVDLHVTYHGLAWGPEGDLYFSSGDPLLNFGDFKNRADHWGHWTIYSMPEGTRTPYTGQGGFYRCRADGSRLQVVAGGTRGTCGLAFDQHWNLFSNDNDHESLPADYVPARLLYVSPKANFFWPRGWMASKTPDRADLLRTMFSGMGRGVPVGQTYYNESLLPAKYRHNTLVARWGQRRVDRYAISPRGAAFSAEEFPLLVGNETARPVGVAVGRGGRLFVAISQMAGNEGSPKYPSDLVMITRKDDPASHPFDPYDAPTTDTDRLWRELSCDSWWRRQRAHVEILRRGGDLLIEALARLQTVESTDPAATHLLWLAAASRSPDAAARIRELAAGNDRNLRRQAVRATGEFYCDDASRALFRRAAADPDPQIQHAAVIALFRYPGPVDSQVIDGPARSPDTYLRQAAALLLAERASRDQLAKLLRASDWPGRMAGVLATGFRLTIPPATGPLPDNLPLAYHSANAKFVVQYADRTIDLKKLGRTGSFTIASQWKSVPHSAEQTDAHTSLALMLDDEDSRVRLQAAYFLSLLDEPALAARVADVRRRNDVHRLAGASPQPILEAWVIGPVAAGRSGNAAANTLENGPIDLSAEVSTPSGKLRWKRSSTEDAFDLDHLSGTTEPGSYYLYTRLQSASSQRVLLAAGTEHRVRLWLGGRPVGEEHDAILDLEPGSNDLLLRVDRPKAPGRVRWHVRALRSVGATLPEKLGLGTLADRLKAAAQGDAPTKIPASFLSVDWSTAAAEGNAERGRKLFGADALGCVKCHGVVPGQKGSGAPSLAGAAGRFSVAHLVESILLPDKQVAPIFRSTAVVTGDGVAVTGLVVDESDTEVVVVLPDAARRTIDKKNIDERKLLSTSPMPGGIVKTPGELRDLLAYLLSKNPKAP